MQKNNKKMTCLAAILMAALAALLIFAIVDANRINRSLSELQQTVNYEERLEPLLFYGATAETAETAATAETAKTLEPELNFTVTKSGIVPDDGSYVPVTLGDVTVCIPVAAAGQGGCTVTYCSGNSTAAIGDYKIALVEGNSSATTTRRCTDLSRAKSFVQEWVNLDCPTLKRFSTNQKVLSVNGFGVAVPLFESPLVDTSYVDTVIADDIEDKEIEGLRKHLNPDGVISQLLNNVQKARAEKEIDEVESRVKQVETQIRLFLRTPEIENEIKDIETAHLNEEGGFDCGFIFWYPKADSQLEKDMSLLVGANRRKLSWLDIAVPTFSQSINVQRYGAELIKKLVKERLGIELYYRSELD